MRSFQEIKKLDISEKYNKSPYAQTLKSELDKSIRTGNTDSKQLNTHDFTQAKIRKFVGEKWKIRFTNFCQANPFIENILQKFQLPLDINPNLGADGKVSNTQMFQGQSFEGGTFVGQLVRWSVKIVRELPSFSLFKEEEDNFFHNLVVYLSKTHICQ